MISSVQSHWPCLTADAPALPGTIRQRYEDFVVEEIPAYEPCGTGDHAYFVIERSGLSTTRAVTDIARALRVPPNAIGYAGLKDARAVTRQTFSLEHADSARIQALEIPRIRIVSVDRHKNKLKTGHLRGNRFIIKLRDTEPERVDEVRAQLALLHEKGIPNYFGPQRFGLRGDTGLIGQALLLGNPAEAASLIAGRPGEQDSGDVAEARRLYDDGRFAEAADTWPRGFMECVRLCRAMAKTHGNARSALRSLGRRTIDFYLSAWQSMLFNDVVGARIDSLDRVRDGDLAWKHVNGAVFGVEGSDSEQPRADRFEISPTGPIFGRKMKRPRGAPAAIEAQVLSERDISPDDFQQRGWLSCTGVRRPLRFRPEDARATMGSDEHGAYIELGFTIQPGCYATTLLREICKDRLVDVADAQPTMLS